ncbi:polysaccharide deacetylase family protein [Clostridium manihotivorum]|uniref:polysaccharide deacetylase family protein n=1 Tax=Clostridium manihotivorum TaxID=2320868 RepID=UPI0013E3EBC5|nr:polysaccharide deacetylase family protein [Clostridium manihotivorum]
MFNNKRARMMARRKRRRRVSVAVFTGTLIIAAGCTVFHYRQGVLVKKEVVQASVISDAKNNNVNIDNTSKNNSNDQSSSSNKTDSSSEVKSNTLKEINKELSEDKNSYDAGPIQDFISKGIKINDDKKIAFLTFDDGPSTTVTPRVLDILKNNNIKATFFIVGKELEKSQKAKDILLDTYKQGNAIGNHTYTHVYKTLYPNGTVDINSFMGEVDKNNDALKGVLGKDFVTRLVRFPGGHMSWKGVGATDKIFDERGYKYIDWNALTGDAEAKHRTKEQLFNKYKETFKGQKKVVILMHDTYGKETSAEVLQDIITDLKNKGYEFKTLK